MKPIQKITVRNNRDGELYAFKNETDFGLLISGGFAGKPYFSIYQKTKEQDVTTERLHLAMFCEHSIIKIEY